MENKKIIRGGLIALCAIILIAGILYKVFYDSEKSNQGSYTQEVGMDSPVNIALDFYNPWLKAVQSTSTDPYTLGLATDKILSNELRTFLISTEGHAETDIDPVLCQTTTPQRVTGRVVSEQENETRVLIMAKEKELTGQSVFTLKQQNGGWFIDSIACAPGEFGLPREFSFETEGYLLKDVPPPLNPEFWHIVFEQNGELGHVVPLLFDAKSSCVSIDKTSKICAPIEFMDGVKIHIYGQTLEHGIEVKRLEFIE